ncbi:MAG: sigma-54-dependent Fis family transcriptional regulator, partial [Deltaproteobacteria bacterium]
TSSSLAAGMHAWQKTLIAQALQSTGNRKGEAAKLLGISRKTLWEKMKQFGMV